MFDRVYSHQWMSLSKELRTYLTKIFNIPTSGVTEIRDQDLISDGKTNEDLSRLSKESLSNYVGNDGSFAELWELTLTKATEELNPNFIKKVEEVVEEVIEESVATVKKYCEFCDTKSPVFHKKDCPVKDK